MSPDRRGGQRVPNRPALVAVYVGGLPEYSAQSRPSETPQTEFHCCSRDINALRESIILYAPQWIVLGADLDDDAIQRLVRAARAMRPGLKLAILGRADDLPRCDRWLRRGCALYVRSSSSWERVAGLLRMADAFDVSVVDGRFNELGMARTVGLLGDLTKKEKLVLALLCAGFRNGDIAHALDLSQSTVEFHVRNVLSKLGARNRVEAVRRAMALGLASPVL